MNFWKKLRKPIFVTAPMANVTDFAFRQMFAKYGKPDVIWTEFVSADGLASAGKKKLLIDLKFSRKEKPVVAQLFTGHPDVMKKACTIVSKLNFDGIDINMGCPDKKVEKQGGGASIIKNQKLALELISAARQGVEVAKKNIPISVKTRLGYNTVDLNWIKLLLEQRVPALTVHLRTRKEMSDVPAHWEYMKDIVRMRNEISPETLIIGNGDIVSMDDARDKVSVYGCDGVMVGRGIFGKPWFFEKKLRERSVEERLKILVEHTKLYEKTFGGKRSFDVMKKHFKAYVNGWDGAKDLRISLMATKSAREVDRIVKDYVKAMIK